MHCVYCRVGINWRLQPCGLSSEEPMTDMGFPVYAEDMYRHIQLAISALRVPVYITETGIADKDDKLRARLIDSYYAQVGGRARPVQSYCGGGGADHVP